MPVFETEIFTECDKNQQKCVIFKYNFKSFTLSILFPHERYVVLSFKTVPKDYKREYSQFYVMLNLSLKPVEGELRIICPQKYNRFERTDSV
jgi:hypothetical protein